MNDQSWKIEAACLDADPDAFFPSDGANGREAKAICARCPVIITCGEYAFEHGLHDGFWGGMSPRDRERILRKRNKEAKAA